MCVCVCLCVCVCICLPHQSMSKYSIWEQREEAHVLPHKVKYSRDIALPLLNKANKGLFWSVVPHLSENSSSS